MEINSHQAKTPRHIGIIGGMGPRASTRFLEHLVQIAHDTYGANRDEDYPRITLESIPLKGFTAHGLDNAEEARAVTTEALVSLEQQGAQVLAMPCNTLHSFYESFQSALTVPLLNMIEETVKEVAAQEISKICILSTAMTRDSALYDRALEKYGVTYFYPSEEMQPSVEAVITALEEGREAPIRECVAIAREALSQGADAVLLGCTELSLLPPGSFPSLNSVDSSRVLAERTLEYAYADEPKKYEHG